MKIDAAAEAIVSVAVVDFSSKRAVRKSDSTDVQKSVDFVFIGADVIVSGKNATSSSVAELLPETAERCRLDPLRFGDRAPSAAFGQNIP